MIEWFEKFYVTLLPLLFCGHFLYYRLKSLVNLVELLTLPYSIVFISNQWMYLLIIQTIVDDKWKFDDILYRDIAAENQKREVKGIQEAMRFIKMDKGYIVTLDQMDKMRVEEGWIEVIPVYELENYIRILKKCTFNNIVKKKE